MRKLVVALFLALAVVGLLIAVNSGSGKRSQAAAAEDQDSSEGATAVSVLMPRHASLRRTTTQPATVRANYQAKIYAKVAGYLKELRADIGKNVKKNDILGVISVPEMDCSLETQKKTVERLGAEEKRAAAGVVLAEAVLEASRAAIGQAQAEIAKASAQVVADQAELRRIEELVASKSIESRLLDETRKHYDASLAAKAAAEASLAVAKAQVLVAQAKLATAQSELQVTQAETVIAGKKLEELETMRAYSELRAPFDGVVTQRHVDPGDLVRSVVSASEPPRQPLFTVVEVATVRASITVPEKDAPWLSSGKAATLKLQSLPGRVFQGHVSRTSGALDESTRTMMVEVDLPNPKNEILPGMYGEATIVLEEKKDALVLSAKTVRHDEQGNSFVYVVGEDDIIHKTELTIGMDDGIDLEILCPLEGHERVVDATLASLKDGQRVAVQR